VPRSRSLVARWFGRILVAALAIALVAGSAVALATSQANARRGVGVRFAAHAGLSANFVGTYVSQLTAREKVVATTTLAGPDPATAFAGVVQAFGFPAAVLLDSRGLALAVAPTAPAEIGTQLGAKYAHLTAALAGRVAVSNVVPSAAKRQPVVAFAVPFDTASGLRVFSCLHNQRDPAGCVPR
jgi:hypothetical protein